LSIPLNFDLPPDVVLPVERVDVRLDTGMHPFERDHAQAIDENWQREIARNPALFDGTVVLLSSLAYREGELSGTCHPVRFATFMHWRRMRSDTSAEHLYAHAMPVSSDGALIAIRMAGHTVNAGRVYFAAGSLEPEDTRGDRVDLVSNMAREVREETGLDLGAARTEEGYHGWSSDSGTVLVRRYFLDLPAEEIVARIRAHIASETDPEIDEAIVIRGPADLPGGLMAHMVPLVEWHFGA